MKLILDFIPSHSSDQHEWFQESRKGGGADNPLADYYIWDEGTVDEHGTRQPPSNKVRYVVCFLYRPLFYGLNIFYSGIHRKGLGAA